MMNTQHPPFAVWSDDDHSGPIIIVTTICLFYWLIPGVIQQATSISRGLPFTYTEGSFLLSMASGIVQSSLVLVACHYGLGKSVISLRRESADQAKKFYYLSNLFFGLVLGLIKCSVAFFVATLTVNNRGPLRHASRQHKTVLGGILLLTITWTIASIVALALPCGSESMCVGTMRRWTAIFVGDAITDFTIAISAANVIWRTNAIFRVKFMWYFPYFLRACVPICAGLRLITITQKDLDQDPTLTPWLFAILSQAQILLSLIAYISPALKKAMLDLVTNYGAAGDSQSGSRTQQNGSYAMDDLRYPKGSAGASWRRSMITKKSANTSSDIPMVNRAARRGDADSDDESQRGIMRCDEIEISYDNATPGSRTEVQWE